MLKTWLLVHLNLVGAALGIYLYGWWRTQDCLWIVHNWREDWRWLEERLSGHISRGPFVLYGFNAMHVALNVYTPLGWFCLHPPMYCFGKWWPWYIYLSPDATPQARRFGFGPGIYT